MGYKKLDEIMELLTEELNGFDKALIKLQKLTKNVDGIKIKPDISEIEDLLKENLTLINARQNVMESTIGSLQEQLAKSKVISKFQLWVQYSIWFISLLIIGYLGFKIYRIESVSDKIVINGKQETAASLREYFKENTTHYQFYQQWIMEKDSVPNEK